MAKAKLSKAEIFYIASNPDGLTSEGLAKELGRSVATINRYRAKAEPAKPKKTKTKAAEAVVEPESELEPEVSDTPYKGPNIDALMGKHKNREGIVVMTPPASQKLDETRNDRRRSISETLKSCVFKPKG